MDIFLPKPHPAQQQILDCPARYRILCCGRRFGKSLISQVESIQYMLDGKHVGYASTNFNSCKQFLRDLCDMLPDELVRSKNLAELRVELITGGSITFFSGNTGAMEAAVRGKRFHLFVVDEAAHLPELEYTWINIIMPTLLDYGGRALLVSTPKGKNYFYHLYMLGLKEEGQYRSFNFPTHANPHIRPEDLQSMIEAMPVAAYRQEILAIPSESDSNPFPADRIMDNTIDKLSSEETVVYGIDLGSKHDPFVCVGLDEHGTMTYFYEKLGMTWPEILQFIRDLPSTITKVMDATGLGQTVYGQLEMEVRHLRPFNFTNPTKHDMIQILIKAVEMGQVKFNKYVAEEMFVFEQKQKRNGMMTYEAQPGYHDDSIMALGMAYKYLKQEHVSKGWRLFAL